jgi:hypothetical protein
MNLGTTNTPKTAKQQGVSRVLKETMIIRNTKDALYAVLGL